LYPDNRRGPITSIDKELGHRGQKKKRRDECWKAIRKNKKKREGKPGEVTDGWS